jgi:hypothetical protein
MQGSPLDHQRERPRREPASQDRMIPDADHDLAPGVSGVKVRSRMVVRVHLDDDAEEATDLGHGADLERGRRDPDAMAATHTITIPNGATTYTATFKAN